MKNQKRHICLQIQILKLKSRQSAGHWKFRLNFILEFGAESSVEYLISCMFFMCVFSDSFCFCAFCWIPICFFISSFLVFYFITPWFRISENFIFSKFIWEIKKEKFSPGCFLLLANNIKKRPSKIIPNKRIHLVILKTKFSILSWN